MSNPQSETDTTELKQSEFESETRESILYSHLTSLTEGKNDWDKDVWNNLYITELRSFLPNKQYVDLSDIDLRSKKLSGIDLSFACLKNVKFSEADLSNADFSYSKSSSANFSYANLNGATFINADLHDAIFIGADLSGAKFMNANLKGACFSHAHLEHADFSYADIKSTDFVLVTVDGETIFTGCPRCCVDDDTNFSGVSLSSARIEPQLLTVLEKNIRKREWEKWYSHHNRFYSRIMRLFWWLSDYGTRTDRAIYAFLAVHLTGYLLYMAQAVLSSTVGDSITHLCNFSQLLPLISSQFSKFAAELSCQGLPLTVNYVEYCLGSANLLVTSPFMSFVSFLVTIISYVLLAVLVTRFAIMFQSKSY